MALRLVQFLVIGNSGGKSLAISVWITMKVSRDHRVQDKAGNCCFHKSRIDRWDYL
jgi:hypothetical protein